MDRLLIGVAFLDDDMNRLTVGRDDLGVAIENLENIVHIVRQRDDPVFGTRDVDVR